MRKIFAMEEISEIPYDEPASETEAANELIDTDVSGKEIITKQEELGNALCIANTLEAVCDEVSKAPDGVSPSVGRALTTALEHLCNIDFGDGVGALGLPAFEEFSTTRAQKNTALESIEKIKEFGKKVWKWIVNLIKDIIASIKKLFNIQTAGLKEQESIINLAIEKADVVRKEVIHAPVETKTLAIGYTPEGFRNQVAMHRLSTNGRFVGGQETVISYVKHHELLCKLETGFLRIEADVIKNLQSALKNIFVSGKAYSQAINAALVAVTAPLSGHQIANKRELPPGVRTFETPLIFGGMSIYREAVVSQVELENEILHTSLEVTSNMHAAQLPESSPYLTMDEIERGLKDARTRTATNLQYVDKLTNASDELSSLEKLVGKIAYENTDDAHIQRRARRILQVIHVYFDTRRVFANSLVSYSKAVTAAYINYCTSSLAVIA